MRTFGTILVGVGVMVALLLFGFKYNDKVVKQENIVVNQLSSEPIVGAAKISESEYEPITLNEKHLATRAEYDTEKKVVAKKVKDLGKVEMDWDDLVALQEDWQKVMEREKCLVNTSSIKLPEDGLKIIHLTASAIENGRCL